MKVANFKKLFSIILSVLICITFIISIGNAGVSVEASTENVIKNDNVNDKYTQIKDSYQTNSSYYSVEDVVNELFNDLQIKDCNYLYNLDDRPDYIYVEFQEGGYAIFFKETMELLEYSAQGTLEYSNSNSIRYYGGPGSYLIKLNGECYINTITDEKTYIRKESAIEYSQEVRSVLEDSIQNIKENNISYDYSILDNSSNYNIEFSHESKTGYDVPKYDDYPRIHMTDGEYIDNASYFTSDPSHGTNSSGTCGAVAAQLLLSYNNYYNDRRIIEDKYLNGYDSESNSIVNIEQNPNYCTDPMSMTSETLGTSGTREDGSDIENSYFAYLVKKIPSGASHYQVRDGIESVLSERNSLLDGSINYSVNLTTGNLFGAFSVDPSGIVAEIEANRPTILLMQSRLGGTDHYVVAYGYNNYKYPGSQESYLGFITHFGWGSSDLNVWVNSAWCCSYITLEINHEHNYYNNGTISDGTSRTEYVCNICGYRTDGSREEENPQNVFLDIANCGKNGNSWKIKISNFLNEPVTVYYNTKMCFSSDAAAWQNLTDIDLFTLSGKGVHYVTITENAMADAIVFSYIKDGVRYITYCNSLGSSGGIHVFYDYGDIYSYTQYGMEVSIVRKNGGVWYIKLKNNTGGIQNFYYNSKMCNNDDAYKWSGLSDITQVTIAQGATKEIKISENALADSIVITYASGDRRYIFYANHLAASGTMSSYGTSKNYYSYTKNNMKVSIVAKNGTTWLIELTNKTGAKRKFYYNKKMCFSGDAKNWTSLADLGSVDLENGATTSKPLEISENALATSIAISYMDGTNRKIFYADTLNEAGTMKAYESEIDTTNPPDSCVAEGTLITLADGTQKPVEELTGNEMLLVWNMYTGTFDSAPILCIDSDPIGHYESILLSFADGTTVDVLSEHGFFDVDLNKYVYLDEYAADYIGHDFLKQGESGMTVVTLVDVEVSTEVTVAYSPVTYGHLCYFVNGMLSMPGGIDGLFNIFDVDTDTMMYDTEAMAADIEQYGLYTYEELNALVPVPEEMFEAVNGQYLKVAVGKGIITIEQIGELIEMYADLFE